MKSKVFFGESKRQKRSEHERLRCSLCQKVFRAASKYHRFCRNCKMDEELFRFSDWLPAVGVS